MKSACKNFKGLAVAPGETGSDLLIARLRCKEWSCDFCAQINQSIWRAHIIDRVNKMGGEWLFITVTAHQKAHAAGKTLENLKSAWKKLYDRLRYKFPGQKLEYVWLYERHTSKRGAGKLRSAAKSVDTYHIHAIVRASIAGRNKWNARKNYWYHPEMHNWLKDNAAAVGAGYMCHCAKIEDGNGGLVSAYITKYMTKAAQTLGRFPKYAHRIQTSRGFGSPKPPKSELEWSHREALIRAEAAMYDERLDVSTGKRVPMSYFDKHELYPPPGEREE